MSEEVKIVITGDSESAKKAADAVRKSLDDVEKKTGGMKGVLDNFKKNWIGITAAMGGLVIGIKKSVEAYAAQGKAEAVLGAAIEKVSDNVDEQVKAMAKWASQQQSVTKYGDEVILMASAQLSSLTRLTGEGLQKAVKASMDLATAQGMDLNAAALLVGKTIGSSTNALGRYGIEIGNTTDKTAKANKVIEILSKKFGGFAEKEGKSAAGQLAIIGNAIGDLQKEIGKTFMPVLIPMFEIIKSAIVGFSAMPTAVKTTAIAIGTLIPVVLSLNAVMGPAGILFAAVVATATAFMWALGGVKKKTEELTETQKEYYKNLDDSLVQELAKRGDVEAQKTIEIQTNKKRIDQLKDEITKLKARSPYYDDINQKMFTQAMINKEIANKQKEINVLVDKNTELEVLNAQGKEKIVTGVTLLSDAEKLYYEFVGNELALLIDKENERYNKLIVAGGLSQNLLENAEKIHQNNLNTIKNDQITKEKKQVEDMTKTYRDAQIKRGEFSKISIGTIIKEIADFVIKNAGTIQSYIMNIGPTLKNFGNVTKNSFLQSLGDVTEYVGAIKGSITETIFSFVNLIISKYGEMVEAIEAKQENLLAVDQKIASQRIKNIEDQLNQELKLYDENFGVKTGREKEYEEGKILIQDKYNEQLRQAKIKEFEINKKMSLLKLSTDQIEAQGNLQKAWNIFTPKSQKDREWQELNGKFNELRGLLQAQVPSFAEGADFITSSPQLIMVGDNPSGRERVTVTPEEKGGLGGGIVIETMNVYTDSPMDWAEQMRNFGVLTGRA